MSNEPTKTIRLWVVDNDSQRIDVVDVSDEHVDRYMSNKEAYFTEEEANQAVTDFWITRKQIELENREAGKRYRSARQNGENQW